MTNLDKAFFVKTKESRAAIGQKKRNKQKILICFNNRSILLFRRKTSHADVVTF